MATKNKTRLGRPAAADEIDDLRRSVLLLHGRPRPRAWALWLRPFMYLLMTLVWLTVFVAGVGAIGLGPVFGVDSSLEGGLSTAAGFAGSDGWLKVIVILVLMGPVLGAAMLVVALAAGGLTLGAATLFVRSLNPAYRGEQLSFTLNTVGETFGPPSSAQTSVALSLLPIRLTRWAKIVQIIEFNGWIVTGGTLGVGAVWGLFYVFTIGWLMWPATGGAMIACLVLSALLLAAAVTLLVRRLPRTPLVMPAAFRGSVYEQSWPTTPEALATQRARADDE